MGFLDFLLGKKEEKEKKKGEGAPFRIRTKFVPVRLKSHKEEKIDLIITLKNITDKKQLVSCDVLISKNAGVGFDSTCLKKVKEVKFGEVEAGEEKEKEVILYSSNQTKEGNYNMLIIAYQHYLNYEKVLGKMKKKIVLRIV
ncbi:hypothetical protein KAW38_04380 [Candidatus Micrarchaeota archaeon]|nr:hypothetical protein [Candidatus Micrarchaeota archaeon]